MRGIYSFLFISVFAVSVFSALCCRADDEEARLAVLEQQRDRLESVCLEMRPYMKRPGNVESIGIEDNPGILDAYAEKNGTIIFSSGMMDFLENDDEVAVVCGHELAHLDSRDFKKERNTRILSYLIIGAGGIMYETSSSGEGRYGGIGAAVLGSFLMAKKSRTHEREADRKGLLLAWNAGYDPRAAAGLWKRIDQRDSADETLIARRYTSTHPINSERIENFKVLPVKICMDDLQRDYCDDILLNKRYVHAYNNYGNGEYEPAGRDNSQFGLQKPVSVQQSGLALDQVKCGMGPGYETTGFHLGGCIVQSGFVKDI